MATDRAVLRLRAAPSAYAAFGAILGVPMVVLWASALRNASMALPAALMLVSLGVAVVWLRAFEVELDREELRYRSLFGGRRAIRRSEITGARFEVGVRSAADRARGPLRLVVRSPGTELSINAKVFRADELARLRQELDVL